MIPQEPPLLDLFNQLRRHGVPLGVDDYMAFLRAVQVGIGIENQQLLKNLCCTLWVKSDADLRTFNWLYHQQIITEPPTQPFDDITPDIPVPSPEDQSIKSQPPPHIGDDIEPTQAVLAIRSSREIDLDVNRPRFNLLNDYFPVTRRQMKQSWRHLRRMVREGPLEELDIQATIKKIAQTGFVAELKLIPKRVNRAQLVLMVDQDGSMVPFHALTRQLIDTAHRGGRLGQADVYYFHDCPERYLSRDITGLQAQPLDEVLQSFGDQVAALIVSDAGAARGHYDLERVRRTEAFIRQMEQSVRRYAWLNPMPHERWRHTTADDISHMLPMFEMNSQGLNAAISVLRGLHPSGSVRL